VLKNLANGASQPGRINNMAMPEWIEEAVMNTGTHEDLKKALAIAIEALEHMRCHSGRTVYEYEDEAIDALRRIEELK